MIDGLLALGFGGPTPGCCRRIATCRLNGGDGSNAPWTCEAECFVSGILGDQPGRAKRVAEVAHHYEVLGGFSPYHRETAAQMAALASALAARGHAIPVAMGFRHWQPWISDGLAELTARGCSRIGLLVLAPHQSSVSWDWYLKAAGEALAAARPSATAPTFVGVIPPWYAADGFISGSAAQVRNATVGWSAERFAQAGLIFTAHAIPQPVERTSPYRQQVVASAALIATALGHPDHAVAFQSAPDDSRIPWSTPTIAEAITAAQARGVRELVVQACGFIVDHTEVLWDLDHEAIDQAQALGMTFTRVPGVGSQPDFINHLADMALKM